MAVIELANKNEIFTYLSSLGIVKSVYRKHNGKDKGEDKDKG